MSESLSGRREETAPEPPFRRVTSGISRTVFLVGRYAVKVPCGRYGYEKWLRGLLANRQEREWSRAKYPELCPVLFADPLGLVVIMPRCEILTRELTGLEYHAFFGPINEATRSYRVPTENKPDSFGYLNGRLVAVDYGN